MRTSLRVSLALAVLLWIITLLPLLLFGIGLALNALWGCDIRDESGTIYGDCATWQSDIAYSLLLMPWFMLVTMPFAGIPAVIATVVTLGIVAYGFIRRA